VLQAEYSNGDKEVKKRVQRDYRRWVHNVKKAEDTAQNNENEELYKNYHHIIK
jgi:predicted alpha/beta hydrolase